ncbi:MAG: hypothetical protein RDV41_05725 [Planctomycetota bacterium]|nr:hypothetical protein [Planctomycetota bacterium]
MGLLNFPKELFEGCPMDIELHVFDIQTYLGCRADWLRPATKAYEPVLCEWVRSAPRGDLDRTTDHRLTGPGMSRSSQYKAEVRRTAAMVNQANLDILLIASYEDHVYDVIDLVETPCIVHLCTGSDVLYHEKVSFQVYCQPQADFYVRGRHLFSAVTRSQFGDGLAYEGPAFYDRRGMDMTAPRPAWKERKPLIFWHGSLYKIASPRFLRCICRTLKADRDVQFVFMGKDDGRALSMVSEFARRTGVGSQVHYEGSVAVGRLDAEGRPIGNDTAKVLSFLTKARLWPDSWPMGGGAARFEAYASGTPSVHMGVRFDPDSWGRRQESNVELPAMMISRGTAFSADDYQALCVRCLHDEPFADALAAEQMAAARELSDPVAYWRRLLGFYKDWLARTTREHSPDTRQSV